MDNNKSKIWDQVYLKYQPSELPWHHIEFPKKIIKQLTNLDKNTLIIVPGCGTGETVKTLLDNGFKNIIGTDISEVSIGIAKKNFPKVKFKRINTENLHYENYHNINVFDWMNLHQIPSKEIEQYLLSLQKICSNLILVYIFEPKLGKMRESYIPESNVYNHKPERIINVINDLTLVKKIDFKFKINPNFGEKTHKAVALYFQK